MADRALLTVGKLEAFKRWLYENHIPCRLGRGEYQVLQVFYNNTWQAIFYRDRTHAGGAIIHLTVPNALIRLVKEFIKEQKKSLDLTSKK